MRWIALILLATAGFGLSGCSSQEQKDPNEVSTIPWNRPERWEGQGPLGSMLGGGQ
jgi:hypothetical protein